MQLPFTFPSPLATDRLVLRFMRPEDADDIHAYQSREDVCRYLLYTPRDLPTVAAKVAEHAEARTLAGDRDYWQLAVTLDDRVIGDVYFTVQSVAQQTGEIGWTMHPDFHGRGYMSEAAGAVLAVAFGALGMRRMVAHLDPRNTASAALCRRLGMRHEAHFVEDVWEKGEWADTGIYAILAREWASRG